MSLITRSSKGEKLTITEMDNNLIYLQSIALSGGTSSIVEGSNYKLVSGSGDPTENGLELLNAYQAAVDEFAGLSPSTIYTILVGPGYYYFTSDFELNTPYINVVSLTGNRDVILSGSGSMIVSANNIYIKGIDALDKAFLSGIPSNLDSLIVENCKGGDNSITISDSSHSLSGTFIDCEMGTASFCGPFSGNKSSGNISGNFIRCKATSGFEGQLSGNFDHCVSVENGFGYNTAIFLTTTGILRFCSSTNGLMGPIGFGNTNSPGYSTNSSGGRLIYCSDTSGIDISFTSPPCLVKGTKILLSNGNHKNIEDISYDDTLVVWNFDDGKFDTAKPLWIKRSEKYVGYNLLKFSDGTELKTLLPEIGHRIFNIDTGSFTYPMTDTPIGSSTFNENGNTVTLISKEIINEEVEFYNIITDNHLNLFANTILTSCRFNNIYKTDNMKYIKDNRILRTREEFKNISDRFYYGLRLSEQTLPLTEIEQYINRLERMDSKLELVFE